MRHEWVAGVDAAVAELPWNTPVWSSENPQPMDPAAVSELMRALHDILPDDAPVPQIHPNWDGGAMAIWEFGNVCLEIEAVPGRHAQYLWSTMASPARAMFPVTRGSFGVGHGRSGTHTRRDGCGGRVDCV